MMTPPTKGFLLSALCAAALLAAGCETVAEPEPFDPYPFTVHGYLDPRADTQAVRIFAVADWLEPVAPAPPDARVTSRDLTTGAVQTWADSLVRLPDGSYRHVFWSAFRPEYEHRYRLDVERSDGAASYAEVTIAPDATPLLLDPISFPGTQVVELPVLGSKGRPAEAPEAQTTGAQA